MATKAEHRRRQLHYRFARFLNPTTLPLQGLLTQAFAKLDQAGMRLETVNPTEKTHRVLNSHKRALNMQFGTAMLYSEGTNRTLVVLELERDVMSVEQIAPPSEDGKRREFLESVLYFGVLRDHVVMMQSSAFRASELEAHFNWFLHQAGVLDADNNLQLVEQVPIFTQ